MLQAGGNQRMCMGVYVLINLGVSSGQISIVPVDTAASAEVNIHIFGAIGVGMLTPLAFLICSEHLVSIPALFCADIAATHDGGLARG